MDLAEAARRLLDDYDSHNPGTLFADDTFHLTVEQACELQIRVAALRQARGESIAGYKIGCVSETLRRQLGLTHAVFGHIFSTELHESGCELDEACYRGLAVEGEFAVRIGADGVFPVIELHNYVFRSASQRAQELIANNAIHAGVVLPAGNTEQNGESLSVYINGEVKGISDGCHVTASLRVLREQLERFDMQLKPGQIVLTGSTLPLFPVGRGDRIEIRCPRFPAVTAVLRG